MWRYIVRRLMWVVLVMLIITLITFVIFYVMPPIDPAVAFAGKQPTPEIIAQVKKQFGLDKPLWVQYGLFVKRLFVGAALVWLCIGIPIGIISAIKRRSLMDRLSMGLALFFVSAPVFWLGLVALWLLWLVLALLYAAFYARMTRGNLIETMGQDYIRTARVKGLPEWKVILKHGLRASLTPVVTMFGMDLGSLFGTAVVTESVFNLQGMGQWAIISVFAGDIPTVLAVVSVTAVAIALCNLIVD